MESPQITGKSGLASRRLLAVLALCSLVPLFVFAATPSWWSNPGVLNGNDPNDYAAVNQGQVKNIAVLAVQELDANFKRFSDTTTLDALAVTLSATTPNTNDYAAVNLGQLKALAKPFFDVLLAGGYEGHPLESGTYPWLSGSAGTANDYAMANIGQVKNLFSFDVTLNSDGSGLPDWWKNHYGITLGSGTTADTLAPRGDGLSYAEAYHEGLNPNDFYNGVLPTLTIVSGNNQTGSTGQFLPQPLVVLLSDSNNNPLANAPVKFSVTSGSGTLQATQSGTSGSTLTVNANLFGRAIVYFSFASTSATNSQCQIACAPVNYAVSGTFTENTDDGTGTFPSTNPPQANPQPIPVQNYAAIDISGSNTEIGNVNMIALDDSNNVAFGYSDSDQNYHVYTWQNGTLSGEQVTNTPATIDGSQYRLGFAFLTSTGEVFGGADDVKFDGTYFIGDYKSFSSQSASVNCLELPSPYYISAALGGYSVEGVSSNGSFVVGNLMQISCSNQNTNTISGGYILNNGSYTVFDEYYYTGNPDADAPPNITLKFITFSPYRVNNQGKACGYGENGWAFLDGDSLSDLPAFPIAINDNNQVICTDWNGGAWLWSENGTQTIQTLLPDDAKPFLSNIIPKLLSNQDSNGTCHIVFNANNLESGSNSDYVLDVTTGGSNTVEQISVPAGVAYTTINAQGVLAFIHNNSSNSMISNARTANAAGQSTTSSSESATILVAGILVPITFTVTAPVNPNAPKFVIADQAPGQPLQYQVNGWEFLATASIPNISGVSDQIKCGVLRDMQFECTKNVTGSNSLRVDIKTPAFQSGKTTGTFVFDTPCSSESVFTSPLPAHMRPTTDTEFVTSDVKTITWHLDNDTPALGVTPQQLPNTISVSDEIHDRYYLFVQVGNANPTIVSEIECGYKSLFTAVQSGGVTTTLTQQPYPISWCKPDTGKTLQGGTVKHKPVTHSSAAQSDAIGYLKYF